MAKKTRHRHRTRSFERAGHLVAAGTAAASDMNVPLPSVRVIAYGPQGVLEKDVVTEAELPQLLQQWPVAWVDVAGLGDPERIRRIGKLFGVHDLAIEDVLHVHQRPKLEPYAEHLYLVMRMCDHAETLETEQVSLFLGKSWVLTFQEDRPGDCFDPVRDRIRKGLGRLRESGPDHLAYALIDAAIDAQFPVLEAIGERLERLEESVLDRPVSATAHEIQLVKRDLLVLRRIAWPTRDALGMLHRDPSPLVGAEARLLLRDCHDHAVQIMDLVETFRELAQGLMDMYLSSVSNRMNEIMKVLTIISTIFMPLSFVAGVYGMNFHTDSPWNMPELSWRFGYFFCLGIMALVALVLLGFFWHRGWLTEKLRPEPESGDKT